MPLDQNFDMIQMVNHMIITVINDKKINGLNVLINASFRKVTLSVNCVGSAVLQACVQMNVECSLCKTFVAMSMYISRKVSWERSVSCDLCIKWQVKYECNVVK